MEPAGPPGSWGSNTIFVHFPPLYRMRWWFPLIAQGQRESKKERGIQTEATPLQLQVVLHSTDVSQGHTLQYPAFYRWDGTQGHLFILEVWGKKTTPLSVSYRRSTFPESRWFVLIWIMQCLIFIFYQKMWLPIYNYSHRLLRLVMEIFMPFLWRRDEKGWPTPLETSKENNVCCRVLASKLPIGEDLVLF